MFPATPGSSTNTTVDFDISSSKGGRARGRKSIAVTASEESVKVSCRLTPKENLTPAAKAVVAKRKSNMYDNQSGWC